MEFGNICLLLAISALAANAYTWKNCDSNAPAMIKEVHLSPANPIPIKKGAKITISGAAEITKNAGVNYKLVLKIKKKVGWFWPTIPCISNMGSCTYTGLSCQKIWQELNKPAQCPVAPGIHKLPSTTITVPDINLPSFLSSGRYWVQAKLYDADNNRLAACVEVDFKLKA